MKKENKILLILLIISFLIRIAFAFVSPVPWWDETVYANLGYDLSRNFFYYSLQSAGWSDFIPGSDFPYSWPNIGFRAPLLPYTLSLFYFLKLNFLIDLFIPIIGSLSVLLVYFLGKILFNKRIAFYSALFFAFLPLHLFYSGMILTEVYATFFILLVFISFWKGYEEEKNIYKILFGFFLALAILTRYTALWIIPIFPAYFLIRDKSFKFLKDKYLWYSVLTFFAVLIPWFTYGYFSYGNPFGAFIHGFKASAYWGGTQYWYFFFENWLKMFSIIGIVFILSIIYIIYKKEFFRKEIYLLLMWFVFFFGLAIYMPHKEERFILPFIPVVCLLSGFFADKIKKYRKIIFFGIIFVLVLSNGFQFYYSYKNTNIRKVGCFLEANYFLKNIDEDILIISDESSIVYYYTKHRTRFYPGPWNLSNLRDSILSTEDNERTYIFFISRNTSVYNEENIQIKQDLNNNFDKVFECSENLDYFIVYKYS